MKNYVRLNGLFAVFGRLWNQHNQFVISVLWQSPSVGTNSIFPDIIPSNCDSWFAFCRLFPPPQLFTTDQRVREVSLEPSLLREPFVLSVYFANRLAANAERPALGVGSFPRVFRDFPPLGEASAGALSFGVRRCPS
jgi:hypothetical protein